MTAVEKHDFTTTPECPWCGERECERHCAECGRERYYRDGRHMGENE